MFTAFINNFSLIDLIFFAFAIYITPEVTPRLIKAMTKFLKKLYTDYNSLENEQVIFSCWAGAYEKRIVYFVITFMLILLFEIGILYQEPRMFFFSFVALLFLFVLCWNSIARIEVRRDGIGLYKMYFGTETQVSYIKNKYIKSIHRQLTVGKAFSGGLNSWLVIKLKKGTRILFPPPTAEDCEILFGFLENQQVSYEISTDLTAQY